MQFGSYFTSPEAHIIYLTQQLVDRERILQAEKDAFMAGMSEILVRVKSENVSLADTVARLEGELAARAQDVEAVQHQPDEEAEALKATVESLGGVETIRSLSSKASALEEAVQKLNAQCTSLRSELESAKGARAASSQDLHGMQQTAKALSLAHKTAGARADRATRDLENEKAMNESLASNLDTAEKLALHLGSRVADAEAKNETLRHHCKLMTTQIMHLSGVEIIGEIWRTWFDVETRRLTQIMRQHGRDMFAKAAIAFVFKYRGTGEDGPTEAEKWVRARVEERNAAEKAKEAHNEQNAT
jgi:chromosome segregation ATPase